MKKWYSILVFCIACGRVDSPKYPIENTSIKPPKPMTNDVELDSLSLLNGFSEVTLSGSRNIGGFFNQRLQFYTIDNPNLVLGTSRINALILSFLDSSLVRMRYEVDSDAANYLLDSLGVSRFKPLDEISKSAIATKNVVDRYSRKINASLRNYELVWRGGKTVNRYRSNQINDSTMSYLFYHEIAGYKERIREVEALYNYMDKNYPIDLVD